MQRPISAILLLSVLAIQMVPAGAVSADVAPPEFPPGSSIGPDDTTRVQMVAEEVVFDVPAITDENEFLADMTATFYMKNQGSESESMRVGFPLGCGPTPGESTVTVDGLAVAVLEEEGEPIILPLPPVYDGPGYCETMPWIRFDVTFPPGQDVVLVVKQSYRPSEISQSFAVFGYILESGAGWYGNIGKGSVIFNLPYKPDDYNFHGWWNSSLTLSRYYGENFIKYTFNDLEPTSNNNLIFKFGIPYIWQAVDEAKQEVANNPNDPTAYIQLGQAYQNASWDWENPEEKSGPRESIMKLALAAYERALELDPYAVDAHAGIASMIWDTHKPWLDVDIYSTKYQPVLEHLSKALALAPGNKIANEVLEGLGYNTDDPVVLPTVNPAWLPTATITSTASKTPVPTNTLPATKTSKATAFVTKTRTPEPKPTRTIYRTFTTQFQLQSATPSVVEMSGGASDPEGWLILSVWIAAVLAVGGYFIWQLKYKE